MRLEPVHRGSIYRFEHIRANVWQSYDKVKPIRTKVPVWCAAGSSWSTHGLYRQTPFPTLLVNQKPSRVQLEELRRHGKPSPALFFFIRLMERTWRNSSTSLVALVAATSMPV